MSLNVVQLFLALIVFGSLAVACSYEVEAAKLDKPSAVENLVAEISGTTPYATLASYNDRWSGSVTLYQGGSLPIRTEILVTQHAEELSREEQKSKSAYAILNFSERQDWLGAGAEVTHSNVLHVSQPGDYYAVREFLLIKFTGRVSALSSESETRHGNLLEDFAHALKLSHQINSIQNKYYSIEFRGERRGARIEGKVFGVSEYSGFLEIGTFWLKREAVASLVRSETWSSFVTDTYIFQDGSVFPK